MCEDCYAFSYFQACSTSFTVQESGIKVRKRKKFKRDRTKDTLNDDNNDPSSIPNSMKKSKLYQTLHSEFLLQSKLTINISFSLSSFPFVTVETLMSRMILM